MKPVIAKFILHIQDNQQTGGNTDAHAKNIDR
jgi:hypothetical protein